MSAKRGAAWFVRMVTPSSELPDTLTSEKPDGILLLTSEGPEAGSSPSSLSPQGTPARFSQRLVIFCNFAEGVGLPA